jgi:hypothetical protein
VNIEGFRENFVSSSFKKTSAAHYYYVVLLFPITPSQTINNHPSMPNIRQTYRHQQLRNRFTAEQLRVINEELTRIREACRLAFDRGGDPQTTSTGAVRERDPNPVAGDQQPIGTEMLGMGVNKLPAPGTEEGVQNPTGKQKAEVQVTSRPTLTTTTTASSTFNSTSIISMGPTTITTTITLAGPTPITTTTIRTTGVTTITTDMTPFITINTDTDEESTTEPDIKHQKTDCSEDTGMT